MSLQQSTDLGPVAVYAHNVLDRERDIVVRAPAGLSLRQLMPVTRQATLCQLNGEFVLPEDMDWVPSAEDHVRYTVIPKGGGNASQSVLGIVLIVVGFVVPGAQALIYVGAGLLVSGLLPAPSFTPLTEAQTESPSPTYNINLGGNSARIGQPIPVPYGRHILIPDFAAQSYSTFDDEGTQFYHALFCLGQMNRFTLESIMIDDTELSHFEEVQTQLVGPNYPGALSLVHHAVVNAAEVASQDMLFGEYVGPFASSGPGTIAMSISLDMLWPKGLYLANNEGVLLEKTTQWLVEARQISGSGAAIGDWFPLGVEELTAADNKPIRRSYDYPLGTPGRYEVRVSRQDVRDDNIRAGHDMQWLGMRTYMSADTPMEKEPSATFLALRMRATSQLSGLTQRRISLVITRWLRSWNPTTGWGPAAETRSIAWALADVATNTDYGAKLPDTRIDLQTLYELDQEWAERGDTFNGVFDKRITVWAALTTIARAGRARPIMRGNVITFVRDSQQELPVALFNMRNIKRGSFSMEYNMLSDDESDGLLLTYFNEDTWSEDTVVVLIANDGTFRVVDRTDDQPVSPANMAIMGVTTREQAEREALYIVADHVYRRNAVAFTTEMEGYLPAYGDLVAVSHDLTGWGVSGDVEAWDEDTQQARLTEQPNWTVGDHYAVLTGPQGDLYGPYRVQPGTAERTIVFVEEPDPLVDIYTGTERERTRFAVGPASAYAKLCKIVAITPKPDHTVELRVVVEDNRVHAADGGATGGGGGGTSRLGRYAPDDCPAYDAASDDQLNNFGFFSNDAGTVGAAADAGYTYAAE